MDLRATVGRALHSTVFIRIRLLHALSFVLPDNRRSGPRRAALLRLCGAKVGRNCVLRGPIRVQESFAIAVGDDVFMNSGCTLDAAAPITIGSRVEFGFGVTLITSGHQIGGHERRSGPTRPEPITIGDGAWLGAGVTVLPGVTIGAGTVVAAASVVTHDIPDDVLAAGTPARVIRPLD